MNLQDTIQTILTQFGVEVLQQPKRFLSLFSDVAPTLTKEKALLQFVMQPEVMKQFQPCNPRDETARLFAAKRRLEGIVAEDALQQVLDAFAAGLGWTVRCGGTMPIVLEPVTPPEQAVTVLQTPSPLPIQQSKKVQTPPTPPKQIQQPKMMGGQPSVPMAEQLYQRGKRFYEDGNYPEAEKWYRQAANLGHAEAQYELGKFYQACIKHKVKENPNEVRQWFRKAAEQGHVQAQYELGDYYRWHEHNYAEAAKWYRKAAVQGDAKAQSSLAHCYYTGESVGQDYAEAVKWYRKAANQEHAWSQYHLGRCYEFGSGVPKSKEEAVFWYKKAAGNGNSEAQKRLMSPFFRLFG